MELFFKVRYSLGVDIEFFSNEKIVLVTKADLNISGIDFSTLFQKKREKMSQRIKIQILEEKRAEQGLKLTRLNETWKTSNRVRGL